MRQGGSYRKTEDGKAELVERTAPAKKPKPPAPTAAPSAAERPAKRKES